MQLLALKAQLDSCSALQRTVASADPTSSAIAPLHLLPAKRSPLQGSTCARATSSSQNSSVCADDAGSPAPTGLLTSSSADGEQRIECLMDKGAASGEDEQVLDPAASQGGSPLPQQRPLAEILPASTPEDSACASCCGTDTSADNQAELEAAAAIFAQLALISHLQQLGGPFLPCAGTAVIAMPVQVAAPASVPAHLGWDAPVSLQGNGSHSLYSNVQAASCDGGKGTTGDRDMATPAAGAEQTRRGTSEDEALAGRQPPPGGRRAACLQWVEQSDGMLHCSTAAVSCGLAN